MRSCREHLLNSLNITLCNSHASTSLSSPITPLTQAKASAGDCLQTSGADKMSFFDNFSSYTTPVHPSSFHQGISCSCSSRFCSISYCCKKAYYIDLCYHSQYLPLFPKTHTSLWRTKFVWSSQDPTASGKSPGHQFLSSLD